MRHTTLWFLFFSFFFPLFFICLFSSSSSLVSRAHKSTWVDARRKHWRWNHTAVANGNDTRLKGPRERKGKKVNHTVSHSHAGNLTFCVQCDCWKVRCACIFTVWYLVHPCSGSHTQTKVKETTETIELQKYCWPNRSDLKVFILLPATVIHAHKSLCKASGLVL